MSSGKTSFFRETNPTTIDRLRVQIRASSPIEVSVEFRRKRDKPHLTKMPLPTHFTLNTGASIPAVGFGTWQAAPHEVERAVEIALREGYRHLDCAAIYRNETEVGQGIRNSGVPREEIFLTSKLWNTNQAPENVEAALDQSLKDLGVDSVDLYLMHWPV